METPTALAVPDYYRNRTTLSPTEAAKMIGIDRSTFYRRVMPYVWSGAIQSIKIGSRRCIFIDSLLAWLNHHRIRN